MGWDHSFGGAWVVSGSFQSVFGVLRWMLDF